MSEGGHSAEGRSVSGESLNDVLASIRALVTAETSSRIHGVPEEDEVVLMLTPDMRVDGDQEPVRSGEILAQDVAASAPEGRAEGAPIFDEEAIRKVVNRIVREELQGELGDRISRNLRKLIRREIGQMAAERRDPGE